ncbi:replication factor C subunit 1 isoform X1 [Hippocampus comes]|uniref:replication factor C subunit 1 isoform X1 n=1 Tax=Hippocampus comes TaxID=109280 RepID=UPI00094E6135|nr:PREDICTED: replication factor C subunit 1 isoform X1 [Hippocampus comes]
MDIRRFFAPSAQKATPNGNASTKRNPFSSEEELKKKETKIKKQETDVKRMHDKKRKKHAVIQSDSDSEDRDTKSKKSPKKKQKISNAAQSLKKEPVHCVLEKDSDSDNFESLKKKSSISKQNGTSQKSRSSPGLKDAAESSIKSSSVHSKNGAKCPTTPVTPKTAPPPQAKQTPTSVLDYFGNESIQRSGKKLVASTKRKTPIQDTDEMSDEQIARQLQMVEDDELEKQIHEDEDFARTLAMLDAEPQAKKVRKSSDEKNVEAFHRKRNSLSPSKNNREDSMSEDMIGPSPKKNPAPLKPSSKLGMLKKRDEEKDNATKSKAQTKMKISPKKEPFTLSGSEKVQASKRGTGLETSPTEPASTRPDEAEKKKLNTSAYRNYLNRDGPRALGSREIPTGADNCLEGCVFVLTGVLESMERDETKSLIERYGGKVTGNVSKKTTYLVQGRDSGVSKLEKAESFGTKILNEDDLFELIRTKPGKKSKYEIAAEAESKASKTRTPPGSAPKTRTPPGSAPKTTPKASKISPSKGNSKSPHSPSPSKTAQTTGRSAKTMDGGTPPGRGSAQTARRELGLSSQNFTSSASKLKSVNEDGATLLWVDKYRPCSLKAVIGQQGEQSCANKLLRWLQNWYTHHSSAASKPPVARFGKFAAGKDDGSGYKAALLSGPPGVGKTTTAALVCEELGFSYVEMNASCTRSKNNLKDVVAESLNNTSIESFYKGTSRKVSTKHVLIMDEVDGMAGNEDRGGMQELISLIKNSKIPIICMCNDRNHQKIRSLANYCFDLRFQRPRMEQIKGAMMSIAFKEGIKIPPPALNEIILASNQDIRQVIHNLSMWSAKDKVMTYDQCKSDAASARKDLKMGPFDVCRKVFAAGEETAHMSLIDKSDLFFHDYSLAPLFVQENYLHVRPAAAGGNAKSHLVLLSKTADSISDGDLVDRRIRSGQNWSLLPTQAIYASVIPGELMRGYMSHFPSFPSWLGKNSSAGKHSRIVQELASHMALKTMSSRQAVNLDYLYFLRQALLSPLQKLAAEGASEAVRLLDDYQLIREDMDNMMEIGSWGGQPDPYSKLDSKVKAAFTRTYNKEVHLTPYSLQAIKKGRRGGAEESELEVQDTEKDTPVSEDEGESLSVDAMIKQKKAKAVTKESKKEKTEDSGKGKGKGKGKAKAKK